jgi:hypothetical protein
MIDDGKTVRIEMIVWGFMTFKRLLLSVLCVGCLASSADAAPYLVTVTGTIGSGYDNAGIFGSAKTYLNGTAFTVTYEVDEATPGSFLAINTAKDRMLVGTYAATPVLGWLTMNGLTRQVQPLQGTVWVGNDTGIVPQDYLSFKASSDDLDSGIQYDDWISFGINDYSHMMLNATAVPEAFSYSMPGSYSMSGNFRFQNSKDGYLAHGEFNPTAMTISSLAPPPPPPPPLPAVPEPASWALMIGGFGVTGAALRRRGAMAVRFA